MDSHVTTRIISLLEPWKVFSSELFWYPSLGRLPLHTWKEDSITMYWIPSNWVRDGIANYLSKHLILNVTSYYRLIANKHCFRSANPKKSRCNFIRWDMVCLLKSEVVLVCVGLRRLMKPVCWSWDGMRPLLTPFGLVISYQLFQKLFNLECAKSEGWIMYLEKN